MGMIRIEMYGSFPPMKFSTSAEFGGHVCAITRSIEFLAEQLGPAIITDVTQTIEGVAPPTAPLGKDNP